MSTPTRHVPAKWPFPSRQGQDSQPSRPVRGRTSSRLTRGSMLVDVCLVLAWGATIPGLMWLGVASGF
ncbi:hypothetical protein [Allopusillimonas ginsengisoli]|uniref:hypothetical protein n=1 Tax=Allopusillimonas ginsengisoli TaxID=453575 RepID=UPI001020CD5A|nr:hypothetical protein [Allopusillimonas ginsengisoli]TEA77390.1 hypothetical protein ERE07_15725 [Allopusillimonas ginsengisoli]